MNVKQNGLQAGLLLLLMANAHAGNVVDEQLQFYQLQGAAEANPPKGRSLWNSTSGTRSCSSCHGVSLKQPGKHIKTGKSIKPMAPSVNSERYQDSKKIEKWFLRNCKWTFGRECDVQEKSNILAWLNTQ